MASENNFVQIYDQKKRKRLIKRDGVVEEYKNGENQYGRKKSSAVEVHTKYSSEYVKTITALANLRGADGGEANDEFLQFIARRKK